MRTYLKIFAHGWVVLWTFGRQFLAAAVVDRSGSARALRLAFEHLGVNWVKLGQSLALRLDVLPADACRELLRIHNDIRPFDYAEVERIIKLEFDRTPEDLFAGFARTPFATTSSGQLHRAIAHTGEHLVVKVQRDETQEEFKIQSTVMRVVAAFFSISTSFAARAFSGAIADFVRQRTAELSFVVAATNARKMASLAEGDALELNITVRGEYSGQRVLSWEFIDGTPVGSLVRSATAMNRSDEELQQGFDQIARQIYRNALNQIFRDGTFHADISAAGLLVLPSGGIAYVDFAVVGRLDDERLTLLQALYENLLQGQIEEAADRLIECADLPASFDNTEFRRSLAIILEDRLAGFQIPGGLPRNVAENTYASLMSAFREYQIAIPADLGAYFRTMLTVESLIFDLCPGFDAVDEQSRFFSLAARQDYRQSFELPQAIENIARLYNDTVELVSDLRRLHNSAQAIEVSLRTLRIRLLQYGFWGFLVAACAYFGLRDETLQNAATLKPFLLPGAFLFVALFLINRVWRQSRQLSRVDRAIVSAGEVTSRSLGRVR